MWFLSALLAFTQTGTELAPCRVGFEARTVFDSSRPYGGEARPIRLMLWYPAKGVAPRPIRSEAYVVADWVSSARAVAGWADADAARHEYGARLSEMNGRDPSPQVTRTPGEPSCTGWLTQPRADRYPLVVLGSGLSGRGYFHWRLAESLADAGFVVAFVSGLGSEPGAPPGFDAASVAVLAADVLKAIEELDADPRVDRTRTALVGWSVAGVTHLLVARTRASVGAAVSLDSGVGYDYGPRLWTTVSAAPPKVVPYLHLSAGMRNRVPLDGSLLDHLRAEIQPVPGLTHAQFTDMVPAGRSPASLLTAQSEMRRFVVSFLRARLGT